MSVDINDAVALRQADTQQLFDQLARCGELYRQGLKQALELPVPTPTSTPASASVSASASSAGGASIHEIVLCSVGGGPVAALRQLSSMLSDTARIPVVLHQGYHMPAYVDAHSLVFIVNYSGGSEEIVSAYRSAIEAGAQVAAITAGGAIAELARQRGDLLFMLPAGQIPRVLSTSHVLVPALSILHRLGIIPDPAPAVSETIALLQELAPQYAPESALDANPAKQLAAEMDGLIPLAYGTVPFTDSAAYRLKYQLAENSRKMAFAGAMSALHHDEAYGWDEPGMARFHVTLIADAEDHERMARRIEATAEVLQTRAGGVRIVRSTGESRLARLCSLTYLFDYATVYAALLQGPVLGGGQALNAFRAALNR